MPHFPDGITADLICGADPETCESELETRYGFVVCDRQPGHRGVHHYQVDSGPELMWTEPAKKEQTS